MLDVQGHGWLWIGAWDSSPELPSPQDPQLTLADIDAMPELDDSPGRLDPLGGWGLSLVMDLVPPDCRDVSPTYSESGVLTGKWVWARLTY